MYYDYEQAVYDDVLDYIKNEIDLSDYAGDADGLREYLEDVLWTADSVTGNGSGSYTFNREKASEYLSENFDLLADALVDFDDGSLATLRRGPEECDVTIRCYLLYGVIDKVVSSLEDEGLLDEPEEEEEEEEEF